MTRLRKTVGAAIAALVFAVPAGAETIQITSGALVWTRTGADTVTLAGEGFTFEGFAATGIFEPGDECGPLCVPGFTVDLTARWVGADLPGTATLNGVTYTDVGGLTSPTSLDAIWTGSLTIPAGFTGGVLTAPFTFTGTFRVFEPPTSVTDLFGSGTASLTFSPQPDPGGSFAVTAATYEFEAAAAPVPEPMSLLLVGTGLAGLAVVRRRRGAKETETQT